MNLSITSNTNTIPDRINSTLNLPARFKNTTKHEKQKDTDDTTSVENEDDEIETLVSNTDDNQSIEEKSLSFNSSCGVSFNKRGDYIAVAYNSGSLGIYDFISRSLISFCYPDGNALASNIGYNSISWSRHSRRILCSSIHDAKLRLVDNTYPNKAPNYSIMKQSKQKNVPFNTVTKEIECVVVKNLSMRNDVNSLCLGPLPCKQTKDEKRDACITSNPHYMENENTYTFLQATVLKKRKKRARKNTPLPPNKVPTGAKDEEQQLIEQHGYDNTPQKPAILSSLPKVGGRGRGGRGGRGRGRGGGRGQATIYKNIKKKHIDTNLRIHSLTLSLPNTTTMSQIHPRDDYLSLSVLSDGSLILVRFPQHTKEKDKNEKWNHATVYYLHDNREDDTYHITYAIFDKSGGRIYAGTKCSHFIGYTLPTSDDCKTSSFSVPLYTTNDKKKKDVAPIRYIQSSPNGTYILIYHMGSSTFALYQTIDILSHEKHHSIAPHGVFQSDTLEWQCFDFSYNEEYIIAGCNTSDSYQLYLFHTTTNKIIHKLSGPSHVTLTNTSYHPYRPFIATSTSDGMIDIWGSSMDWTHFAPDFTPLNQNVEYMEQEHEFDIAEDDLQEEGEEEEDVVDIVKNEKLSFFESDSEEEEDVFYFRTCNVCNLVGGGRRGPYNVRS